MTASLRDMALFVATYEERSFTVAAQRENATQPGVSQHIRKLETQFSVKLFIRNREGVQPTPAGDRFYRQCIEILRAHASAIRSLRPFAHGVHDDIAVGLMPTTTRWALAPALDKFVTEYPNVRVQVIEGFSGMLTEQVQAGTLDFAVVPTPSVELSGLRSTKLLQTPEILVSGQRANLEHRAPVRLADLGPMKMVVPGRSNVRRLSLEHYFVSNNVQIERMLELDAVLGGLSFVSQTDWRLIAPAIVLREPDDVPLLSLNPIHDPAIWTELMMIEKATRPLSASAEAFLELLAKEMHLLNQGWQANT